MVELSQGKFVDPCVTIGVIGGRAKAATFVE